MGLLDNLGGMGGQAGGGLRALQGIDTAGNPKAAILQAVLGMLVHGNQPGGLGGSGGLGGLGGLLQRFQGVGLGSAVSSWMGPGANTPVSPEQVRSALGDGPLQTLADHAGVSEDEAASHLSGMLPDMVDRLTPDGQLPENGVHQGGIGGAIDALSHLFGNRAP